MQRAPQVSATGVAVNRPDYSISIPIESLFEMLLFKLDFLAETKVSTGHQYVIEHIRFPRTIFGIIIGASLSVLGIPGNPWELQGMIFMDVGSHLKGPWEVSFHVFFSVN